MSGLISGLKWMAIRATSSFLVAATVIFILVTYNEVNAQEAMSPGRKKAPLRYALQLPPHCGWDYFGRTEPQYQRMPRNLCGVRTNHFCNGLIQMMMARDEQNRTKQRNRLRTAEKEFLYTQRGIADFPRCPLHPEVETALMQVRMEIQALSLTR